MNKQRRKQWNKCISMWLIFGLLVSMMPIVPNQAKAAAYEPITIAQGDSNLAINDAFDESFWNIGHDASLSTDRIQLTPAVASKKGFAYINDSIHLDENLSFNAKYSFKISESGASGADGIAFVIQAESNTAGEIGEGMGYSGISPSVVVEIDTFQNANDPSESHIAIMKNGDYTNHLVSTDLTNIDSNNKQYTVWIDYNGDDATNQMNVYFAEDNTGITAKPASPDLQYTIDLQSVFGNIQDVFVGFSSATGGSWSKHEILGVFFDSEYTSSGIEANDKYTQAPKPDAPAAMAVTKTKDEALSVTPEEGKDYVFYEDETAVKPIGSGSSFTIDASMNTDGNLYYYSIIENGVQSERAVIAVEVTPDQLGILLNEKSNINGTFYFENLSVIGSDIKSILISFNKSVSQGDKIILPDALTGFTVSDSSINNDYTKRINLSGSVTTTDVQDYLRDVGFQLGKAEQSVQVVVTSENILYDTYYSIDTEHYYQYVTDKVSWTDAYQKVKSMEYMGRTGYLATIMSKEEDVFVNSLSGGEVGWLGGAILKPTSDKVNASGGTDGTLLYYEGFDTDQTTDAWYWMNGPEIGTKFYASTGTRDLENNFVQSVTDLDNSSIEQDYYFNWGEKIGWENQSTEEDKNDWREPNTQIGPNEDSIDGTSIANNKREMVLSTLSDSSLDRVSRQNTAFWWNDRPNDPTNSTTWDAKGYFVEFGNLQVGEKAEKTVTTFAADTSMLSLPKPDAPSPITITKDIDQDYTVTPESGPTYNFYDNETDTVAITSGSEFIIDSNMNTHEKRYYYSVKENGIESDRSYIEVLIDDEDTDEDIGIKTSQGITNYTSGVVIDQNLEIEMKNYETLDYATVIINDFELGDSLIFSNQNGISGSYNEDNGVLKLSGEATVEQYEDALQSITFETTAMDSIQRQISFTIGKALYFDPTQHFYEFVEAEGITWHDARDAASEKSFYGRQGYLATITSEKENDFVTEKSRGAGWLGASDADEEGVWEWVTGPENGQQFWQGDGSGEITNDLYENWYVATWSEPNNGDGNGEDYLHIFGYGHKYSSWATNAIGYWNDFASKTTVDGYLVEYGGLSTDSVEKIQVTDDKIIKFYGSGNYVEVENGIGTGIYQTGNTVAIEAYTPPKDQQFKEWQVTSDNIDLANNNSNETTFTMPDEAVKVTAIYEAIPTYEVNVVDGSGTGIYQTGKEIEIKANEDLGNGKKFKGWNITSGEVILAEPSQSTTTFVMPSESLTIEAIYTYSLQVKDGAGTGDYEVGDTVNIEAEQDIENGKKIVKWQITSSEVILTDDSDSSTTFTMPKESVTIEAIYSYAVIVKDGEGTGDYQAGEMVTIKAAEAPEGQKFKEWKVISKNHTLTDSSLNQTTFTMPEESVTITAMYEQMTEKEIKDQLKEAADALTIDTAFNFSEDDTWESITLKFLMLRVGMYQTSIDWESSKPNVIAVEGSDATTFRQEKDESVILKATISKAGYSIEKPFLLIAKSKQIAKKESESIKREANIDFVQNTKSKLIERINLYDSNNKVINKIDKIIINKELITTESNQNFSVYLSDDTNDLADELAIEINSAALKKVLGNLEVKTDQAIIHINKEEIELLNENGLDLFFRVVPLRDKISQDGLAKRMHEDKSLQSLVSSISDKGNVKILGTPKEIETNYSGYKTDVILPIGEFYHEDIVLDNIHVYIEHSDGTIDIQKGTIIYENDTPVGYKFSVDKFSTFTLFEVANNVATDPIIENENPTDDMDNTENDQDLSNEPDYTTVDKDSKDLDQSQKQSKNINSNKENKLPITALNMFRYLIVGVLLFGVGVSMYYFQRRRLRN